MPAQAAGVSAPIAVSASVRRSPAPPTIRRPLSPSVTEISAPPAPRCRTSTQRPASRGAKRSAISPGSARNRGSPVGSPPRQSGNMRCAPATLSRSTMAEASRTSANTETSPTAGPPTTRGSWRNARRTPRPRARRRQLSAERLGLAQHDRQCLRTHRGLRLGELSTAPLPTARRGARAAPNAKASPHAAISSTALGRLCARLRGAPRSAWKTAATGLAIRVAVSLDDAACDRK